MGDPLAKACASWSAFGRRFIRIRCKDGKERGFNPNGAQLYIARRKRELIQQGRKPWFLLPKARRMGVTTRESIVSFYRCRVFSGQWCVAVAFRDDDITAIFDDQAQRFLRNLPDWYQPKMRRSNKKELVFEEQGSRFYVVSGAAKGGGGGVRGGTVQRVHVTEAAYAPKNLDMDDIMAGYTLAASHGDATLESTGDGPTGWFYDECMRSLTGKSDWSVIFCPWFLMDEYTEEVPDGLEIVPGEAHHEDYAECVQDEREFVEYVYREWGALVGPERLLWRRKMRRAYSKGRKYLDQFPERIHDCFQAGAGCFFDTERVLACRDKCREPIHSEYGEGWRWLQFYKPEKGVRYIAGMDIAEGVEGGDYTYLTIHRRDTMEQVACWHGHIRPKTGARLAIGKAREYNGAEFVPERNNHGITVVDEALEMCYPGLYYHSDGKPGWRTDGQTRPELLDGLSDAISEWSEPIKIHDRAFWDECIGFRRNSSGKYEGSPDDRVMALGLTLAARSRSTPVSIRPLSSYVEEESHAA